MKKCADCSQSFDAIMIDVPVLEQEAEIRYEFFSRRPDSDLCHRCLLRSVVEGQHAKPMSNGAANGQ